jgi:hypothetical protein
MLAVPGWVGAEMTSATGDRGAIPAALAGNVSGDQAPLHAASVYAYRVADLSLRKVFTDADGEFSFSALPAGLYKIVAHKPGFIPAVVLVTRATAASYQQLELDLASQPEGLDGETVDFWTIRERIPTDVLRQMTYADAADEAAAIVAESGFDQKMRAEMRAVQGRDSLVSGADSQMLRGTFDLEADLGRARLDLTSRFSRLSPISTAAVANVEGESNAVALSLVADGSSRLEVTSQQSELLVGKLPIDFERYGISWSTPVGRGRSRVEANFVEESNFYSDQRFGGFDLPQGSRTWQVSGSYQRPLTRSTDLRTGVTYRERSGDLAATSTGFVAEPLSAWDHERIDLYGVGELELHRKLDLEVGLFGTLVSGDLVLAPHVGVKYNISEHWRTRVAWRERLDAQEAAGLFDFIPLYYRRSLDCSPAESGCYRWSLSHERGDDSVAVGFVQREYNDTLRIYFSDDFFDQLQSLFLVAGDQLPELQLAVQRRLGRRILARFESSVGRGGGGQVELVPIGIDRIGARSENSVDFVMTSLKTQFEATDTGVELAYHSIGQSLEPAVGPLDDRAGSAPLDLDSLRLFITQDLRRLLGLSSDWALLLDMQVSRGGQLDLRDAEELRRRIVGGVAVRF